MTNDDFATSRPTLLAVLAHPDDETFGIGGTLAYYARKGINVYLVCATRGDVGDVDPKYMEGFATVAERRQHELRCAARILGLSAVYFLDYRDSGMPGSPDNHHPRALAAAPREKVVAEVAHYIRLLRPHVVITFDPLGGYMHPDHIAIHQATVSAFHAAAKSDYYPEDLPPHQAQKLYYSIIPRTFLRPMVRIMRLLGKDPSKFGKNGDIDLAAVAAVNLPVHAVIDYRIVARERDQAAACHVSQGGAKIGGGIFWLSIRRLFASHETFMQGYPEPQPGVIIKDLFDGVRL
ncbi:MAG: GlcNAc-PI de-N-acetylase [Anaerolineae bacterium]|nr:GlcNAc-PI de-N-acetylase [Anaerolineae bacterium]